MYKTYSVVAQLRLLLLLILVGRSTLLRSRFTLVILLVFAHGLNSLQFCLDGVVHKLRRNDAERAPRNDEVDAEPKLPQARVSHNEPPCFLLLGELLTIRDSSRDHNGP